MTPKNVKETESDNGKSVFLHPTAGHSKRDPSKLAVRWVEGTPAAERENLLKTANLALLESPDIHTGSRRLMEVNNSESLTWIESKDKKPITRATLHALENSPIVQWISGVYRGETSPEGLEGLFSVNPTVLYLRRGVAERLGDLTKLDPAITIDTQRSSRLHGLTVLSLKDVSMSEDRGSISIAKKLSSKLEVQLGAVDRNIFFENIPLIRPTCSVAVCTPSAVEFSPNDPMFPSEWGMRRINAPHAWALNKGDPDIVVAVLDTGVELAHPDLNLHPLSWNATTHTPGGGPVGNHGTACAGIVAGRINNALGVCGVAGECRIMAIATATWADTDIVEGLYFAADNGARVVSMSFGVYPSWGFWNFNIIEDALQYAYDKGLVLVAASGNENIPQSRFPGSDSRTICVGGSNRDDLRKRVGDTSIEPWWGACFGSDLDVVAPCLEIPTTDRLGALGYSATDYYDRFNGTSSATPHVAGLAALILSIRPDLTNEEVRRIIEETCDKISPTTYSYSIVPQKLHGTWNQEVGYGRINAERALLVACNYGRMVEQADPCAVDLPKTPGECASPPAPPWQTLDQCIYWYETRFVGAYPLIFRIVYEHCMMLLGRQQGPLLYTVTLLPGEKLRLYHLERYRRTQSVNDTYSVLTSLRNSVAALAQGRTLDYTEDVTTVLGLFWSVSAHPVGEHFQQTIRAASQQVETERSIVISTYEEKDQLDVTSRAIENKNDCFAVSYFVRRVYDAYKLTTRVIRVDWILTQQTQPTAEFATANLRTQMQWRSTTDLTGVSKEVRKSLEEAISMLPKIGDSVEDPRAVAVPTDGVVYEAELAHCSSCEPDRTVADQIALEKSKAEERKACFEAELVALEAQRRKALLNKGVLSPFDGGQSTGQQPLGSTP